MLMLHILLIFFTALLGSRAFLPDGRKYVLDGDLIIGGLFGIHSTFNGKRCSGIQGEDGIQALEAMVFSIENVNRDLLKETGIKLGMLGVDTCESETISLDNTLEFIGMRINKKNNSDSCGSNNIMGNNLIGIIGPAASELSIPVASILRLFKISQISYEATSPELLDKTRFTYFKRTVPSDNFQAKAVAVLLKKLKFEYVSIVYEESSYGTNFNSELERLSKNGGYCIGTSIKVSYFQTDMENNKTIQHLLKYKNTNGKIVVVLILRVHSARSLLSFVNRTQLERHFYWIGTDGWTGRSFRNDKVARVANGAIGIQLRTGEIPGFKDKYKRLRKFGNKANPWWQEYTEDAIRFTESNTEFGILQHIDNAVRAFGHAVLNMYQEKCGQRNRGVCDYLRNSLSSRSDLVEALGKVNFTGLNHERFYFTNQSEGPPRYSILNFIADYGGHWIVIGQYDGITNKEQIIFNNSNMPDYKPSMCSEPCDPGYAKTIKKNTCCWKCTECIGNQIASSSGCSPCDTGFRPDTGRINCVPMSIEYMDHNQSLAIATMTLSSIGIVLCFIVILVFMINRNTPLVKATDLKLSLIMICALIISYGSSAAFLAKPSPISCGLTRCLLGFSYTLQYATILTKTVRIYRLFQAKSPERKTFINSVSSITLTLLLTFFHVLGLSTWIIFDRPHTRVEYGEITGVLICHDVNNFSYLISLTYPVGLLVACIVFAIKTRKIPDGFKETRFISICSYTTCIVWLGFVSTFFFTHNNIVRVLSLCITLSINSTVCLCVLFLYRVYIIIFKPEQNTRDRVMSRGHETPSRTSVTAHKSVGTNDSDEDYAFVQKGLMSAMSSSVPNIALLSSYKQDLTNAHSMDNLSVNCNRLHCVKTCTKAKRKDLPRITLNGVKLRN